MASEAEREAARALAMTVPSRLEMQPESCTRPRSTVDRFRDLLGVPPGAYERGNDLIKRVIDPAELEVNGLSEFGVKVEVERPYSRAPISGVTLAWWRKSGDEYRATYQERQRSKFGRMARLRGDVEAVSPLTKPPTALFNAEQRSPL